MKTPSRISTAVQLCSVIALAAACTTAEKLPAAAATEASGCTVRAILRLKEPGNSTDIDVLNKVAEAQEVQLDSVTQLGDRLYRVLLRSSGQDCATVLTRLNADPKIAYATMDKRKRIQ